MSFSTTTYWDRRYSSGGISGPGSRGEEAQAKVDLIQGLIDSRGITSILDLGVGDGFVARRLKVDRYVGYDPSAVARSKARKVLPPAYDVIAQLSHNNDPAYDLTMSIDVIFHLVDDAEYQQHLTRLLGRTYELALVYGTNHNQRGAPHVLHREWVGDVPIGWNVRELETPFKKAWLVQWRRPSEAADVAGLIGRDTGELLERYARDVPPDQLIVEIGAYTGRSTCYLAQGARSGHNARVLSIDPHGLPGSERGRNGRFAGDIVRDTYKRAIRDLGFDETVTMVRDLSSQAPRPLKPIGLLWIDGDHSEKAIREDIRRYTPHLAPGARLVIDDYGTYHPGVDAAVKDLRKDPRYIDWRFDHKPLAQARVRP